MYEDFKSNLILKLLGQFDSDDVSKIINVIDIVANDYEINKKTTALATIMNIPEVVKVFMACKKIEGYADGTLTNYKLLLMNFFTFVNKDIKEIQTNDIRVFLYKYQEMKRVSNRTLNKYQQNLKAFFTWCFNEGYIEKNISHRLMSIKYEEKPRQSLSQLELEQVRNACADAREQAIIEFIYSTGCRVGELCVVKKSDIDWNNKSVHLFGKGNKHRISFINAKAEFTLRKYLDSRDDDSEYLFVSARKPHDKLKKCGIEKIVREISARARLDKKFSPHTLRHTTCTIALRNGMPIDEIQKMVGHSSISTTMIYAKTDMENVQASHKKFII